MDEDIREAIIKMIKKKRDLASGYKLDLKICPFEHRCDLCSAVFPTWGEEYEERNYNPHISINHPCWAYGEDYVLAEMKLLFPELY